MPRIKSPTSRAGKLTLRCPECSWPGASHKPHRAICEIPGLVTPATIVRCGKCGHLSPIIRPDGKAWVALEVADKLVEESYGIKLAAWVNRLNASAAPAPS